VSDPYAFQFATASQILFGVGTLKQLPSLVVSKTGNVLLVHGASARHTHEVTHALSQSGTNVSPMSIRGEPTVPDIQKGIQQARDQGCDAVIAIGGGSVLDTGKVIAALLTNHGALMDYLEVIGGAKPLTVPSAFYAAVPTTAGTGAEVTRNAVIGSPEHRVKVSMRHIHMLPALAVVDPALTEGLPPDQTATSGLDAVTQLLEVYTSPTGSPMTDAVCRAGLEKAGALLRAYRDGKDQHARVNMAFAALCSGMALANAKLGAVHGLAGPLGGMFPAPHGAICARLLPILTRANLKTLAQSNPTSPALSRYNEALALLAQRSFTSVDDGLDWLVQWCAAMPVPGLHTYGVHLDHFGDIITKARNASSMKGNPVTLADETLHVALQEAL